ncbi:MAG: META domain-containing protein [Pseudomonadota bacterium]
MRNFKAALTITAFSVAMLGPTGLSQAAEESVDHIDDQWERDLMFYSRGMSPPSSTEWHALGSLWKLSDLPMLRDGWRGLLQTLYWSGSEVIFDFEFCGPPTGDRQNRYRFAASLAPFDKRRGANGWPFVLRKEELGPWNPETDSAAKDCVVFSDDALAEMPKYGFLSDASRARAGEEHLELKFEEETLWFMQDQTFAPLVEKRWQISSVIAPERAGGACKQLDFRPDGHAAFQCCNWLSTKLESSGPRVYRAATEIIQTEIACGSTLWAFEQMMASMLQGSLSVEPDGRLMGISGTGEHHVTFAAIPWHREIEGAWRLIEINAVEHRGWPVDRGRVSSVADLEYTNTSLRITNEAITLQQPRGSAMIPIMESRPNALRMTVDAGPEYRGDCRSTARVMRKISTLARAWLTTGGVVFYDLEATSNPEGASERLLLTETDYDRSVTWILEREVGVDNGAGTD